MSDEFFVGYLETPPQTARRMKRIAAGLVVLAAALATALALATGPFDASTYEYGTERAWKGTVEASPVPVLLVRKDGPAGSPFGSIERFPLVAQGKHGAGPMIEAFDGAAVHLKGTRIVRSGTTMIEIVPGSVVSDRPAIPASRIEDLGRQTFSGEIVDSKCFLGVMNPGRLEVHRACAIRCIAGGIPPMLFARDTSGGEAHLLLVDANGHTLNDLVPDLVARPVTITGRLERRDDLFYLYCERMSDTGE